MWQYFISGGPLMYPLLICSIVALAIIIERCWFWQKLNILKDKTICQNILNNIKNNQTIDCKYPTGILSIMLVSGLFAPSGESEKAMEVIAIDAIKRMRRGMNILDTIITASPMLGIMGTVLGIINAFDMLGTAGVSEPKEVIAGIAQALITTAAGLGIAILTLFPYNYFNSRIDNTIDDMEIYASKLTLTLKEIKRTEL